MDNAACASGEIIRISRQNSSGTYAYFKEAVLGKGRDYKQGYTAQSGSSDLVALVSQHALRDRLQRHGLSQRAR